MLLGVDAGDPGRYQIAGTVLLSPKTRNVAFGLVMPPSRGSLKSGQIFYDLVYGGCVWKIFPGGHAKDWDAVSLKQNGEIVMRVVDLRTYKPLDEAMRKHFV